MKRKHFLLKTGALLPTILLEKNLSAQTNQRPNKAVVTRASESRFGEKILLGGKNPNDLKVAQQDTNGDLSLFEYTGHEKGGPPLHVHLYQDEIFMVVEGAYLFKVGNEEYQLKKGDTIFLPRTVPHTFAQTSDEGKMFFLFQPSGKMEAFFNSMGHLTTAPTPEEAAALFAAHDMKVVGPPLKW